MIFRLIFAVPSSHFAAVVPWQPRLCSFTGCVPCGTTARQNDFGRRLPDVKRCCYKASKHETFAYICYKPLPNWFGAGSFGLMMI